MVNDINMFYTLKWRGTSHIRNIEANTLQKAKERFAELEQVKYEYVKGRIQHVRKASFIESMTKVVRATV